MGIKLNNVGGGGGGVLNLNSLDHRTGPGLSYLKWLFKIFNVSSKKVQTVIDYFIFFRLQEANVEGALNLTREAKRRSDEAALKVKNVQGSGGLLVIIQSIF